MDRTAISSGEIIFEILKSDAGVAAITGRVFPVVADSAALPYVAYRRSAFETNPAKAGLPGADTVRIEVGCFAATYAGSVALAEAVRAALDRKRFTADGLAMRSCTLTGADEDWENDAFVQNLTFEIRI